MSSSLRRLYSFLSCLRHPNYLLPNRLSGGTISEAVLLNILNCPIAGIRLSFKLMLYATTFTELHRQPLSLSKLIPNPRSYLDVTENWWGSREQDVIHQRIFDFADWNSFAIAEYYPYLVSPYMDSVVSTTPKIHFRMDPTKPLGSRTHDSSPRYS